MEQQNRDIAFIGLGVMGQAMCQNLSRSSGRRVLGFDAEPAALESARLRGIETCADLSKVTSSAEFVFLCLPNGEAVAGICEAILHSPGVVRAVIDCSTTSVKLTRALADQLSEVGIDFADAPIARMRNAAKDGTLLFTVGAQESLFDQLMPLLSCMGTDILRCGPVGSGQVVKILNNMVLISHVHALATALAAARAQGVLGETLFDAFAKGSADSQAVRNQGIKHLLSGDFPEGAFSTIYARKDIGLAQELFLGGGIDTQQLDTTADLLDRAVEAGLGQAYYPAFARVVSRETRGKDGI